MKKIGLFVVLCALEITAGAWGLERGFVSQPVFNDYGVKAPTNYTSSPLYALLREGKTNFTACISNHAFEAPLNRASQKDNFKLLNQSLTQWIVQVRKQIEQSGRAEEFADILAWLPSKITLTPASCEKADIRVRIISGRSAGKSAWVYDSTSHAWQLAWIDGENALASVWKESGSFWGLGNLTQTFHPRTIGEGRLENTVDKKYSLYAVVDSHPAPGASVMWWKEPTVSSIACDDVEGFINAVDYVEFMEGESSARLENGWKSLCGHPYYYLRGRAALSREELASLRQETEQHRQTGQTLVTLQELLNQWDSYRQKQVMPVLSQYRKLLAAQPRPLDDKGLMLSAQVNHLNQVNSCAFDAVKSIAAYGKQTQRCVGTDCPALRQELDQLNCSVGLDPFKTPGLLQAIPLEQDYPTGKMHTCGVCGKPIEMGEERYDAAYGREPKRSVYYSYFRHATCPHASLEQARAYHDHVTQVQAPTYGELQARVLLAENLVLPKHTVTQMPETVSMKSQAQEVAPALGKQPVAVVPVQVKPVSSLKKAPVKAVTSAKKTKASAGKQEHFRVLGTVEPGEKVHCSVCGKEIHEGDTYYKRTESQFMHRHGQCAYSFFTKKHDVDEESLASYARTYPFETPAEVASARADMEVLGLSVDTVRQLRTQRQAVLQQHEKQRVQNQERKQAQAKFNAQCRVYHQVTEQEVAQFKAQHRKKLMRIAYKQKYHQGLTHWQRQLQTRYEQLLKDAQTTQECLALEQAAR